MYLFKLVFSLGICSGVRLLDQMITLFLVFKGLSIVTAPVYIPTNSIGGFLI